MALQDRKTLADFFKAGSMPQQGHFQDLIDSMVNKIDDGFSKSEDGGVEIAPELDSERLISFYESTTLLKEGKPSWFLDLMASSTGNGLALQEVGATQPNLYLQKGGNIGIGTSEPAYKLDVAGTIASTGRAGNYKDPKIDPKTVLADGEWHTIVSALDGLSAFEVIASALGPTGHGEYALLHAIALSAYGNSKSKIRQTTARYKGLFSNIDLRWTGSTHSYELQIRTRHSFGSNVLINYTITQLIAR